MNNFTSLRSIWNLLLVVGGATLAYFLSTFVGSLHCVFTGECSAVIPSVGFTPYIGLILGHLFFVPALLISLGNKGKYWWAVFFVGPVALWPVFNWTSSVVSEFVIVLVIGILVGMALEKVFKALAPRFMSKIS